MDFLSGIQGDKVKFKNDGGNTNGAAKIQQAQNELASIFQEQESVNTEIETKETELAENNEQEQQQVQEITDSLSSAQSDFEAAHSAFQEADSSASSAESNASALAAAAESLPKEIEEQVPDGTNPDGSTKFKTVKKPNPAYIAAKAEAEAAKAQADELRNQANSLKEQEAQAQEVCNEIIEALSELEDSKEENEQETEEKDSELETLKEQYEQFQEKINELNSEIEQAEQEAQQEEKEPSEEGITLYESANTIDGMDQRYIDNGDGTRTIINPDGTQSTVAIDEKTGNITGITDNEGNSTTYEFNTTKDKEGNVTANLNKSITKEKGTNNTTTVIQDENGAFDTQKTDEQDANKDENIVTSTTDSKTGIKTTIDENGKVTYKDENGEELSQREVREQKYEESIEDCKPEYEVSECEPSDTSETPTSEDLIDTDETDATVEAEAETQSENTAESPIKGSGYVPVADLNKKDREILSATTPVTEFLEAQEKEQLNQTTQYILGKPLEECTVDEQNQAYAINILMTDAMTYSEMFDTQLTNDGGIRDGFNALKELTNLGISRSDVEEASEKQKEMISALTDAINGESDKTFEEVWLEQTGVNFDINKLKKYEEDKSIYEFAQYGVQTAADFTQKMQKQPTNPQEILDLYNQYYQDENLANEKFCEMISDSFATCAASDYYPGRVENVRLGEDNQLYITYPGCEEYCFGNLADLDINNGMFTARLNRNYDTKYIEEYKNNFEQATGSSYDELGEQFANSKQSAIGEGDKFQNTVEKYCQSQQNFTKKAGSLLQTGGLIVTATGGIICLTTGITGIGAGVGAGIMNAGTKMSMAGMYLDNGLEALDILSSDKSAKEKLDGLTNEAKAAAIDTAFFALGMKINGAANTFSNFTANEFMAATGLAEDALAVKGVEILSEAGADFTMSIATNYITRGELDLKGEGLQQLREVLIGVARGKVNTMKSDAMESANKLFEQGQYDEGIKTLKDSGLFSENEIVNTIKSDAIKSAYELFGQGKYEDGEKILADCGQFSKDEINDIKAKVKLKAYAPNEGIKDGARLINQKNASESTRLFQIAPEDTKCIPGYGYGVNYGAKIRLGEATLDLSEPEIRTKLMNLQDNESLQVGKGPGNDINMEDYAKDLSSVSCKHMEIWKINGELVVVDNKSECGTKIVDNKAIDLTRQYQIAPEGTRCAPGRPYGINPDATITLGVIRLDLSNPDIQTKLDNLEEGKYLKIGKGPDNDINMENYTEDLSFISDQHVQIWKINGELVVVDADSDSGTYITNQGATYTEDIETRRLRKCAIYCQGGEYENLAKGTTLDSHKQFKVPEGTRLNIGQTEIDLDGLNIKQGETIIIGRKSGNKADRLIDDEGISSTQLKITKTETGYIVQNIDSDSKTDAKIAFTPLMLEHADGSISIHKNISYETFNKLFSTKDGVIHSDSTQQSNGDCYLLSTLNALYEHPEGMNALLSCFTETPDGKVTVKLPNGKINMELDSIMKEVDKNPKQYSKTMKALQAIEYIYGLERFAKAEEFMSDDFDENTYIWDDFSRKVYYHLENYRKENKGNDPTDEVKFREGGWTKEVMAMFGYGTKEYYTDDKGFESVLTNPDEWDKNVYTISTKSSPDGDGDSHMWSADIAASHAYQLRPRKLNSGEIVFDVINPWHSTNIPRTFTIDQIKNSGYFSHIDVTRIYRR